MAWCWWMNDSPHPTSIAVKPSKHSHQRTGEQNAIVTSTRIWGAISSMSMPRTTSLYPQTIPPNTKKQRNKQKGARQWNEMTPSSAVGIMRMKSVSLILKHFQEQWGEEFRGAFHLHVQEAAGMTGSNHPQVCHLHQEFWPKVCHVVFSVIDIVFKGQQETILIFFYSLHAGEPWAIWGKERRWMLLQRWKPFSVHVGRYEDFSMARNEHGCHMNSGASRATSQGVA